MERRTNLLSDSMILGLKSEAGSADDQDVQTDCSQALEGDESARERVAEYINNARAAASENSDFVQVLA